MKAETIPATLEELDQYAAGIGADVPLLMAFMGAASPEALLAEIQAQETRKQAQADAKARGYWCFFVVNDANSGNYHEGEFIPAASNDEAMAKFAARRLADAGDTLKVGCNMEVGKNCLPAAIKTVLVTRGEDR